MGVYITGDKELDEVYDSLSPAKRRQIASEAIDVAKKPLIDSIKGNVKKSRYNTGALDKSIGAKRIKGLSGWYVGARVYGNFKGYHAWIVEYGTKRRGDRGVMPSSYLFRKGIKIVNSLYQDELTEALHDAVVKHIQSVIKKNSG